MINKAIAKITDEMMKSKNPAIRHIEEHLTELCATDEIAEKILNPNKSLKGAYEAMKAEAKRMAAGSNEICISDEEGFRIVDEYFGIDKEEKSKTINVLDLI